MGVTRYRDGNATVTLDGGLDNLVRNLLTAAQTESLRIMEQAAQGVADEARREWYGSSGVTRDTGQSGDIDVVTTFDAARDEVRVSVGSTDTRTAGRGNKPVAVYIHRPGRTSTIEKEVDREEFFKTPESLRVGYLKGKWIVKRANPKASDGKRLLPEYILKPMKAKVSAIAPDIARLIAKKVG